IGTGVVAGEGHRRGGPFRGAVVREVAVVGIAGDAEGRVGLGPTPIAAVRSIAALQVDTLDRVVRRPVAATGVLVGIAFGVGALEPGVAAGVFTHEDGVRQAVDDRADLGHAAAQQALGTGRLVAVGRGGVGAGAESAVTTDLAQGVDVGVAGRTVVVEAVAVTRGSRKTIVRVDAILADALGDAVS